MPGRNGWTKKGDAKEQARFDRLKSGQAKSENDRHAHDAMHRGMSGHPANENNKRGWTEMSDRELKAHGMIRVRGLFGTTYRTMAAHHDILTEQAEEKAFKRQAAAERRSDKRINRKAQKKPLFYWGSPKPKQKKKGFLSW